MVEIAPFGSLCGSPLGKMANFRYRGNVRRSIARVTRSTGIDAANGVSVEGATPACRSNQSVKSSGTVAPVAWLPSPAKAHLCVQTMDLAPKPESDRNQIGAGR